MEGIEAVPRPRLIDRGEPGGGRQLGDPAVELGCGRMDPFDRQRTAGHEERLEGPVAHRPDAAHRLEREPRYRDGRSPVDEPGDRFTDPGRHLCGRKAVKEIVADVGDQRHASPAIIRFTIQSPPQAAPQDRRQASHPHPAVGAVGTAMPRGHEQVDRPVGSPPDRRSEPGQPARDVAGTEHNRRETVVAGRFGRPSGHQFHRLHGGDCCRLW